MAEMEEKPKVLVLQGTTAVGKGRLVLKLAERYNAEIVSADSMKVYRYMDIGTGKFSKEEREKVPIHMIDIVDPDEEFNAALYSQRAREIICQIWKKGKGVIVVGGTGLYIKALLSGIFPGASADPKVRDQLKEELKRVGEVSLYEKLRQWDPGAASKIHPNDVFRIIRGLEVFITTGKPISHLREKHNFDERPFHSLKIGLMMDRDKLYGRIEDRVDGMMDKGWVEEVKVLLENSYSKTLKSLGSLGYRQICDYLDGELSLQEAISIIKRDTRHYAKRQLTWFRKDKEIKWYDPQRDEKSIWELAKRFWDI